MEPERGETFKYLRDKHEVSDQARDNMKRFSKIKKAITDALKDEELTIDQLSQKLNLSRDETLFYLMSMLKYGLVKPAGINDMDEYFTYKLK